MKWHLVMLGVLAVTFGGCAKQRLGLELYDPDVYTRADVDAINSVAQCKLLARNMIQLSRCETRR